MWKSFLDSLVEAFAMCDPVAYMHYTEWKRETARQAVTPYGGSVDMYVDHWATVSERVGPWQDYEDAGASRPRNNPWSDSRRHDQHQVPGIAGVSND